MTWQYFDQNLKISALNSNRPLTEKITKRVGVDLGKLSVNRFSNGETQINIEGGMRGDNIYVIQSASVPTNDNLMGLLIMVDVLRCTSARTINAVMPYYGYAHRDRKARSRGPITTKLVANMLQSSGVDRAIALDLHAAQTQGFFNIPVDHLMGAPLLTEYFINQGVAENTVIISPNHDGIARARALAEFLRSPIAIIDKRHPRVSVTQIVNIIGDVRGKKCIMIDDMVDAAGTISLGSQALIDAGAEEAYASCTHAVLSGPAIERLQNTPLKEVVVADSIQLPKEKRADKIKQVSVVPLIGDVIKRVNESHPASPLFKQVFQSAQLKKK